MKSLATKIRWPALINPTILIPKWARWDIWGRGGAASLQQCVWLSSPVFKKDKSSLEQKQQKDMAMILGKRLSHGTTSKSLTGWRLHGDLIPSFKYPRRKAAERENCLWQGTIPGKNKRPLNGTHRGLDRKFNEGQPQELGSATGFQEE